MLACFPETNLSLFLPQANISQPSSSATGRKTPAEDFRAMESSVGCGRSLTVLEQAEGALARTYMTPCPQSEESEGD